MNRKYLITSTKTYLSSIITSADAETAKALIPGILSPFDQTEILGLTDHIIAELALCRDEELSQYLKTTFGHSSQETAVRYFSQFHYLKESEFSRQKLDEMIEVAGDKWLVCLTNITFNHLSNHNPVKFYQEAANGLLDKYYGKSINDLKNGIGEEIFNGINKPYISLSNHPRRSIDNKILHKIHMLKEFRSSGNLRDFFEVITNKLQTKSAMPERLSIDELPRIKGDLLYNPELAISFSNHGLETQIPVLIDYETALSLGVEEEVINRWKEIETSILEHSLLIPEKFKIAAKWVCDFGILSGMSIPSDHIIYEVSVSNLMSIKPASNSINDSVAIKANEIADQFWFNSEGNIKDPNYAIQNAANSGATISDIIDSDLEINGIERSRFKSSDELAKRMSKITAMHPDCRQTTNYYKYSKDCRISAFIKKNFNYQIGHFLLPTSPRDVDDLYNAGVQFGPGKAYLEKIGAKIEAKLSQDHFNKLIDLGAGIFFDEYNQNPAKCLAAATRSRSKKRIAVLRAHPFEDLFEAAKIPQHYDILSEAFPEKFDELAPHLSTGKKMDILENDFSL